MKFFSFPECCDYWNTLKHFKGGGSEYWKSIQICRELSPTNAAIIGSFAIIINCSAFIVALLYFIVVTLQIPHIHLLLRLDQVFTCHSFWGREILICFWSVKWMITMHSYCLSCFCLLSVLKVKTLVLQSSFTWEKQLNAWILKTCWSYSS